MGDEIPKENGEKAPITLDPEVANGIKHAVATLDETNSGKVAKSQLQAVVANVCQAIKTPFVSDDLDEYLPETTDLSVSEFLEFLQTKLLVKGKKLNPKELDELSWVVVGQKFEDSPHMLTKKDAFKLWLVFKKLDVLGELRVDVEELCITLEKFVRGMGVQWNEQHLNDLAEDGALTYWKFIDCLEKKFLIGVEKNVLREGLQELYDHILDEVTRTGFLTKKGHSVLKTLKSRWFVLKPDKLTYYVSSGYREKKGDIILNNEAKVSSIPDKGSNKCRFLVTCGLTKKDYEQTAPDQRTKQAWMTDIQTAIDCFGGQTPLKRDLIARKTKRDEIRAKRAEEERKKREQEDLLDQQRKEIDLLKKRKEEIEKLADEEKAMLDAEIKRREELEEIQRNLQQLLEEQKRAREEDERIRAAKERLLEEERVKREQLEALRLQQQQELQNEKMQKKELIEKQKEQERILEEERKRLQHLEDERIKAEEAAKAAKEKLTAAETAAKNAAEQAKDRVRQLKTSIGLKGTVGPKVDPLVSHRGKGAFTLEEFLNRATEWSGLTLDEDKSKVSSAPQVDELVKASATPASNQNVPEFLKKAAAWSGLNPDTYLEGTEEEKKPSSPPKVAAKPAKPLPNTAGTSEDVQESQGSQEGGEESQVENKESDVKVDEKVEGDDDGSEKKDDVSEDVAVSNDGSVVVDKEPEVTGDTGESEVAVVSNQGSENEKGSEVKDEGSEKTEESKSGSEEVKGSDECSEEKKGDSDSTEEMKGENVVSDEISPKVEDNESEVCEEKIEPDTTNVSETVPEQENSPGESVEKDDESESPAVQQSPSDNTCSDGSKEEPEINNGEENKPDEETRELNNKENESSDNNEKEIVNEVSGVKEETGDESKEESEVTADDSQEVESSESQNAPKIEGNIVENGQTSDENEHSEETPSNDGDNKPELSEKCSKLNENTTSENIEVSS